MKHLLISILLLTACKKDDISATAHRFPDGWKVKFNSTVKVSDFGSIAYPLTIDGIFYPAQKRDPNYYSVHDMSGRVLNNVPDYILEDY